jgi:hypothetical protein
MPLANKIYKFVKKETRNVASVTHDFGHLKRTAEGAKWFVKFYKGIDKEMDLAYTAGLLHDIVRPPTSLVCHAKASAKRSRQILRQFKVDNETSREIIRAVKDHREKTEWKSPMHSSVFLADKIFEQMGAFIVFRRCMYAGECVEAKDENPIENIKERFSRRLKKINPGEFPKELFNLVKYQYDWPLRFAESLEKGEKWTVEIADYFYLKGRQKQELEKTIRDFKPKFKESKEYKKEALNYIDGRKFKFFAKLLE